MQLAGIQITRDRMMTVPTMLARMNITGTNKNTIECMSQCAIQTSDLEYHWIPLHPFPRGEHILTHDPKRRVYHQTVMTLKREYITTHEPKRWVYHHTWPQEVNISPHMTTRGDYITTHDHKRWLYHHTWPQEVRISPHMTPRSVYTTYARHCSPIPSSTVSDVFIWQRNVH